MFFGNIRMKSSQLYSEMWEVAAVARNPAYSPEMPKSRWFAMKRSAMISI